MPDTFLQKTSSVLLRIDVCFCLPEHEAEFCKPDGHEIYSIEEGLEQSLRETESGIRSSENYLIRLKADLKKYTDQLNALRDSR